MLTKVSRRKIIENTKMESKGEDRNGLGVRDPACVPRERMEKLRRDCKMSEQDPEAEVREAEDPGSMRGHCDNQRGGSRTTGRE